MSPENNDLFRPKDRFPVEEIESTKRNLEILTLGMWIDYVIERNNIHISPDNHSKGKTTQADFDTF